MHKCFFSFFFVLVLFNGECDILHMITWNLSTLIIFSCQILHMDLTATQCLSLEGWGITLQGAVSVQFLKGIFEEP